MSLLIWLVPTRTQQKYQRSVKDFGALGDGAADDRLAIQETIDDVAVHGGGIVYFPAGTYKITIYTPTIGRILWPRALTIRPGTTLQGAGSSRSVIKLADNQPPYGALLAPEPLEADVSGFQMYDLGVDANGLGNPLPTTAEINEHAWDKRLDRKTVFIDTGQGLHFERCRFSNFIGVWCLMLYSYRVSDVSIVDNDFDNVGGGNVDFDSSTVDTAGYNCRIVNNRFYSRNYAAPEGPLTHGLRTAIEAHNVDVLVKDNQIYGFPIGIVLGGNSQRGNQRETAWGNVIKDAYNGIVIYSSKPDDGSPAGMRDCWICDNTITLNVDGWQAYDGKGGHCHGILIGREGKWDGENWNLDVTNNRISYTNYNGTRDLLTDGYSAGIFYDRINSENNTIGVYSRYLRFLQNTIDHPLGNGVLFRAAMGNVEVSGNTVVDPAAGPAAFADCWRAALFFVGPHSDLDVSNNCFIDDRAQRRMPYGIFASDDAYGPCTAWGNKLMDGTGGNLTIPLIRREGGKGSWNLPNISP